MPGIELGSEIKIKKHRTLLTIKELRIQDKREMQETVKHGEESICDILAFRHASYYSNCYPNLPAADSACKRRQVKEI